LALGVAGRGTSAAENVKFKIIFDVKNLNKKLIDFFHLDIKNNFVELEMK